MKLLLVAVALAALPASAQMVKGETAKNMVMEVKIGPYVPLIDRALPAVRPYQSTFGSDPMVLHEVEFEYEFYQAFGTVSAGLSAGYAEKYAHALTVDGEVSADVTGVLVVPLKALASYRFDWMSLNWHVPLVPYAKAALVMMPFSLTKNGVVETADGLRGAGVKYGFAGVLGLSLTLDFLDPRLARDFDSSMGVNHTYLFAEFAFQEMTDFGTMRSTDLDFSSRHWIFGLALEF